MAEKPKKTEHINQYFDSEYATTLLEHLGSFLDETYFRSVLVNLDEVPVRNEDEPPLIYISNHSGMAFPWDGMIFGKRMTALAGGIDKDRIRPIAAPLLSKSRLMNPYQIPEFWKRVGCVDAYFDNFTALMDHGVFNVLHYPEGVPGIGKGFSRKYELQRFSSSIVYHCLKYKTRIIPVFCVNGEYINPYSYNVKPISWLFSKIGIPFLPLGLLTIAFIFQPWIFYMAMPARLHFVKFREISFDELGSGDPDKMSIEELRELSERLRSEMQEKLNEAVKIYGQKPYHWPSFKEVWKKYKKWFPFNMPFGWPFLFAEFEYRYKRYKAGLDEMKMDLGRGSVWRNLLRKPFLISYYIPVLGWLPLLLKGYWRNKL